MREEKGILSLSNGEKRHVLPDEIPLMGHVKITPALKKREVFAKEKEVLGVIVTVERVSLCLLSLAFLPFLFPF